MKQRKALTYFLSGFIPVIIFLISCLVNSTIPFSNVFFNTSDAFSQYPSMILTIFRDIKNGVYFYSFNSGLGINLYGTFTYYFGGLISVFNIFSNAINYHYISLFLTLIRLSFLGISMCFYLNNKSINTLPRIMLSISYALCGFTSAYYYNYIWFDAMIMLPPVIYGIEIIIEEKSPLFYIICLTLSIFMNYYIGYMITLFSILFFIYLFIKEGNKIDIIKTFIVSTIICFLLSSIILVPTFYSLLDNKIAMLNVKYKIPFYYKSILAILNSFTPGSFNIADGIEGPAAIYSSLFVFSNMVLFFINSNYSKKDKLLTSVLVLIFFLSFFIIPLNKVWHMFALPSMFINRFAFIFTFLLIYIAHLNIIKPAKGKLTSKRIVLLSTFLIMIIEISSIYKFRFNTKWGIENKYLGILLIISFILLFLYIVLLNKKEKNFYFVMFIFIILELSINMTHSMYVSLKNQNHNYSDEIIRTNKHIKHIKKMDKSIYRMEKKKYLTDNDGLYFDYMGVNYFSSIRNNKAIKFLSDIGFTENAYYSRVALERFDEPILSLLNIKYLVDNDGYTKTKYPLSLAFLTNENIKDLALSKNYTDNINDIYSAMTNNKVSIYETVEFNKFITKKDKKTYTSNYYFTSKVNGKLELPYYNFSLKINDKEYNSKNGYVFYIKKNDDIKISYIYMNKLYQKNLKLVIFNYSEYQKTVLKLSKNLMSDIKINSNNHILEGDIDVKDSYNYLFTTIAYDRGMTISVDGKKVNPTNSFDSLLGIKLSKGKHHIVIDYFPKGLKTGCIITTISFVFTIIYLKRSYKLFIQ